MQSIGMLGRGSLFADNHSMRNGSASREICWDKCLPAETLGWVRLDFPGHSPMLG
jgi:hypothetical protein